MRTLHFTGVLPGATLASAYHALGPRKDSKAYDYSVFGYFGSCHYCFIFSPNDIDIGQAHDVLGHILIQIEEILWGTRQPTNGIDNWRMFQHKEALIGEGGCDVTRLMVPPRPMANGPAAAQEEGALVSSADGNSSGGSVPPSLGRN